MFFSILVMSMRKSPRETYPQIFYATLLLMLTWNNISKKAATIFVFTLYLWSALIKSLPKIPITILTTMIEGTVKFLAFSYLSLPLEKIPIFLASPLWIGLGTPHFYANSSRCTSIFFLIFLHPQCFKYNFFVEVEGLHSMLKAFLWYRNLETLAIAI